MKWAWKVGQFRGIGVYIHATFLILLAFVAYSYWMASKDVYKTVEGVVFILALFGCVVLHEFGHALTAARFGIKTRDITLLPIGGVARLERMPDEPWQELLVAIAGPAVNVVIAGLIAGWLYFRGTFGSLDQLTVTEGPFLFRLMVVNIFLVFFNMLPAFPMDGGRVLRAFLATQMNYSRATQIAAGVGQGMALLFGLLGFLYNPFLLFIALFVWIGAAQESGITQMKSALGGIPVYAATITDFKTLQPDDTLATATEMILSGSQQDFPVMKENRVVGVLTRRILLAALSNTDRNVPVSAVMQRDFESVQASEMLESAFERLQTCDCYTMPVMKNGDLVGLLTLDNIGEFIAIRSALYGQKPS
ncbi:MAG TPA: site-2 protease family protein [Pirellulaceae bacterium]|nr:site-2 protease family protein [Pirellulaceae bacterium]HMO93917.1 site-2 protease family protein [Pirellulaceae bacterium]HMP68955.1 site-2 protease family protein [Pirellulaceae bacterium]